jgi:AdoMet-dependent rRNA methyltransferase SPB1
MTKSKTPVRDKYYHLAKESGFRARSAFKLLQLNRQYGLLDRATRVVDLCAAPGGWLQVCAQAMPKTPERQIVGVDLLPIKPIPNVVTIQSDITTAECRRLVNHQFQNREVDVVLCDGAPNVGSAYEKDALVQAELALHALRFATNHLRRGGSFVTKVFRSADYNALMWVLQQFFRHVEATKPPSSRNVSAEVFVVCRDYLKPDRIDPRLLDGKHVFESATLEKPLSGDDKPLTVDALFRSIAGRKRFREGYDEEKQGATLFKATSASDFVTSSDPVKILVETNVLRFDPENELDMLLAKHPSTTKEIRLLCDDIKVLGKPEFKQLIKWRRGVEKVLIKQDQTNSSSSSNKEENSMTTIEYSKLDDNDDDTNNQQVEMELVDTANSLESRRKREEKRRRKDHRKLQRKKDLGLVNEYAIDVTEQNLPFSLASIGVQSATDSRLDSIRDVSGNGNDNISSSSEDSSNDGDNEDADVDDEKTNYSDILEKQLDADYERFIRNKEIFEPMTVAERRRRQTAERSAKRKKKALEEMTEQDFNRLLEEEKRAAWEKGLKAKMERKKENGGGGSSSLLDDSDDDDNDDDNDDLDDDDDASHDNRNTTTTTDRWFSQPVFENLIPLPSELTDKAKRAERRKKLEVKKQFKEEKKRQEKAKLFGNDGNLDTLEFVPANNNNKRVKMDSNENYVNEHIDDVNERERDEQTRELIRKGMGKVLKQSSNNNNLVSSNHQGIVMVPANTKIDTVLGPGMEYDSDAYDSDERAEHLALGSLLAKKSTRDEVLDGGYNRYAFNDPPNLPAWFAEDESKHNRPNLPVTKEMIESVKARFKDLAAQPIKKVAEARARKKKRALVKLEAAKSQAAKIAQEPDISARSKMKMIEKAYAQGVSGVKKPGKVYVVAGKGKVSGGKGGKVAFVDKRLKKDKKAAKRRAKKNHGGKRR